MTANGHGVSLGVMRMFWNETLVMAAKPYKYTKKPLNCTTRNTIEGAETGGVEPQRLRPPAFRPRARGRLPQAALQRPGAACPPRVSTADGGAASYLVPDVLADELVDRHERLGPLLVGVPGANLHGDSPAAGDVLDVRHAG